MIPASPKKIQQGIAVRVERAPSAGKSARVSNASGCNACPQPNEAWVMITLFWKMIMS